MKSRCFQCDAENPPENTFCGKCGAALLLSDFISQRVATEVLTAVRDRDVLETESAIRVFGKAWEWATLVGKVLSIPLTVVVLLFGWLGWKEFDLASTAQKAKEQIQATAETARRDVNGASANAVGDIQREAGKAIQTNLSYEATANHLSKEMTKRASQTSAEMRNEAASVKTKVAETQTELDAVKKLQPEFDSMRSQLAKATSDLDAQQKVISSSENFVKQVFSTHSVSLFNFNSFIQPSTVVIPAPQGTKLSVVLMLLPKTPIGGTMQLQWGVFAQPPTSYFSIHNLVIFYWGDPPEELKNNILSVSFFPDKSDKETINTLSVHDGRVYGDDQPLPNFLQLLPTAPAPSSTTAPAAK